MAVLDLTENVYDAIEKADHFVGIFLDLSKAFDTIDYEILLNKLHFNGIRGVALDWFRNYLYERKQNVRMNGKESSKKKIINHGVPQGRYSTCSVSGFPADKQLIAAHCSKPMGSLPIGLKGK